MTHRRCHTHRFQPLPALLGSGNLADHIRIDDAIALWCSVEPAELASLIFETQWMSAKRAALVTALRNVPTSDEKFSSDNIVAPTLDMTKESPSPEGLQRNRVNAEDWAQIGQNSIKPRGPQVLAQTRRFPQGLARLAGKGPLTQRS